MVQLHIRADPLSNYGPVFLRQTNIRCQNCRIGNGVPFRCAVKHDRNFSRYILSGRALNGPIDGKKGDTYSDHDYTQGHRQIRVESNGNGGSEQHYMPYFLFQLSANVSNSAFMHKHCRKTE
jgi:hypothetical protein